MKLYKITRLIGINYSPHHNFVLANSEKEAEIILGIKLKIYDSINKICDAEQILNPGVLVGKEITSISKEQLEKIEII